MFYQQRGHLPLKKHTTFYREGSQLYREELTSTRGFSGIYSTKYHIHAPPQLMQVDSYQGAFVSTWEEAPLQPYHFDTNLTDLTQSDAVPMDTSLSKATQTKDAPTHSKGTIPRRDFLSARRIYLKNAYCQIGTAQITQNTDVFYKNAYAHELWFVHHGAGEYRSEYGRLTFQPGDYLLIPKGTLGQITFTQLEEAKLLMIESTEPFQIPKHFRNASGQLLEQAPYCERDFRTPELPLPVDQSGEFELVLKAGDRWFHYLLNHHPLDVVGWDGYLYPFTFNIRDYCPIVGKLHQPPPVHLVFHAQHLVVCNFVPRLFDFHPEAIPAPYFHSNVDSEEVLYYVDGNFMSRSGIQSGSMTLHPMGLPHGPQPGKTEASIGKKEVDEYAVMIDTFHPLQLTTQAQECSVKGYAHSWLEAP